MFKRISIIALLSVLILGGLFAIKFLQIKQAISQNPPPPPTVVAVTDVKQEEWPSSLTAVGSLTAVAGVDVSNEVAGKVKALHFESGHSVRQGQLLLELDASTDLAELKGLQAEQRLAELRFERSSELIKRRFISKADFDQNQAQLDQARATIAAKQAVIDKKQIRAPFTGELGIRQVDLGQYLEEGAAIVRLTQLSPIYLDFNLPERHISQLSKGQRVVLSVQAYPEKNFSGQIAAISPAIEQNTRSLKIRASLENRDKLLHPGMFAQVEIVSGQKTPVLTLPDTAITYNPYGNSVFLVESGDKGLTVQSRQVQTGQSREGRVEILEGLKAGDRVVSAGQVKLRNGMPVALDSKPAPGERLTP